MLTQLQSWERPVPVLLNVYCYAVQEVEVNFLNPPLWGLGQKLKLPGVVMFSYNAVLDRTWGGLSLIIVDFAKIVSGIVIFFTPMPLNL